MIRKLSLLYPQTCPQNFFIFILNLTRTAPDFGVGIKKAPDENQVFKEKNYKIYYSGLIIKDGKFQSR